MNRQSITASNIFYYALIMNESHKTGSHFRPTVFIKNLYQITKPGTLF